MSEATRDPGQTQLVTEQTKPEVSDLGCHFWVAQKERMLGTGLNRQVFFLLQAQVVMRSSARMTLERSIKDHAETVGVIKELAWLIGNADWHTYRSTERKY